MFSDRDFIQATLRKCRAVQDSGLWCPEPDLRPHAWLENFAGDERVLAAVLLDNFVFYSDRKSDLLFRAAYRDALGDLFREVPERVDSIRTGAIFTPVEGERPNPADSGPSFCRRARQVLGIQEERIATPAQALQKAASGSPVIFVDDFVGSGDQLSYTWQRIYRASPPRSFAEAHAASPFEAIYLTLVATSYGLARISGAGVPVRVFAAHVLTSEHSVQRIHYKQLAPSIPNLGEAIEQLLESYAPRLRLPDYMKTPPHQTFGYHGLGLLVGFEHSIPDATIPLLWAESTDDGWTPLRKRS